MAENTPQKLVKLELTKKRVSVANQGGHNGGTEKMMADFDEMLAELEQKFGVPAVNLDRLRIPLSLLEIVPEEIAQQHAILPFELEEDNLKLAMTAPEQVKVIDEIEFVSGKKVIPFVAVPQQLAAFIERCYRAKDDGDKVVEGAQFSLEESRRTTAPSVSVSERLSMPAPEESFAGLVDDTADVSVSTSALKEDVLFSGVSHSRQYQSDELALDIDIDSPMEQQLQSMSSESVAPQLAVQKKILVVDDEDDIRILISRVLTEKGYDVVTASRGLEAVQMVQNESPDMIILDAMLPEVHGFDICRKIKGSKKYGHIPVIMISAIYRGWRYAQDLKDSYGVDDFIEKPFQLVEFLEKVQKHIDTDVHISTEERALLVEKTESILAKSVREYKDGNIDGAIDMLRKGIAIDPLAYKLHYNLALLLGKKSLNYQAIRELESTLELEPDYFPAMKNLALLYQKAGFKFKAIETWERSLHYCPDSQTHKSIKRHLMEIL